MFAVDADAIPNCTNIAISLCAVGPDALERYNHLKWDHPPNDPPNNLPVPNDANNQQGNG